MQPTTHEYMEARATLSAFVNHEARQAAQRLSFGWIAQPGAPDTYDRLRSAYSKSVNTGVPMPVSSLHCRNVIYNKPADNHAFRFWHDTSHVQTGLSFALDDELELGLYQLDIAERNGLKKGSLEWQLLRIDFLGQNYLLGMANRFPINQRDFIKACLERGLDEGILEEIRKHQ